MRTLIIPAPLVPVSDDGDRYRTKVSRVIDEYDLDGFGDELERLWTATGDERKSLRELAETCNKCISPLR